MRTSLHKYSLIQKRIVFRSTIINLGNDKAWVAMVVKAHLLHFLALTLFQNVCWFWAEDLRLPTAL